MGVGVCVCVWGGGGGGDLTPKHYKIFFFLNFGWWRNPKMKMKCPFSAPSPKMICIKVY